MNIVDINKDFTCKNCQNLIPVVQRYCPTCNEDAGAPNVRAVNFKKNLNELERRYQNAIENTEYSEKISAFEDFVKKNSCVVVTMPVKVLRNLLEDNSEIYLNYETLVSSGVRKATSIKNDSHRQTIGAMLFGSYSNEIRYGVLSTNGKGLSTYGDVHCSISSKAIMKRTTFLEENSYDFVTLYEIEPGKPIPLGHTADWNNRSKLASTKLIHKIQRCQNADDWDDILFSSDGKNRFNDDFIEAHIYGSFDRNAIDGINATGDNKLNKDEKLDLSIVLAKFGN